MHFKGPGSWAKMMSPEGKNTAQCNFFFQTFISPVNYYKWTTLVVHNTRLMLNWKKPNRYKRKFKFKCGCRFSFHGAMTFILMTFSIMTLRIMTLSIMTLSIMTLSIMTLTIMTLSIKTFNILLMKCDTQHNITQNNGTVVFLIIIYAKCHYGKCLYAECRGALSTKEK